MQKQPSIEVVGAGGCAINLIKNLIQKIPASELIKYKVIDSSRSNLDDVTDIEVHIVSELGSGKDRAKNLPILQTYLDKHSELTNPKADISIIISSFSGGTGSIASNLLVQRIMKHAEDKAVIVVGVLDASSEKDCLNSINTLKSFNRITKDLSISLPMMLFSNTIKYKGQPKPGKFKVNETVVKRLVSLITLLTDTTVKEIDWMDKMNYLRPQDSGCEIGPCSLGITDSSLDDAVTLPGEVDILIKEENIIHSILVVGDGSTPDILTNVNYVGVGTLKFTSTMVEGIPKEFTQDLADTAERYQRGTRIKTSLESDLQKFGSDEKNGLII